MFINEATLRDYYLRPFAAAVQQAQVASVMESYNELNGVPIAASKKWLRDVLRGELGFGKLLVTDWGEINNLHSFHHAVPSQEAAVLLAMERTSIDMSMVPLDDGFIRHLSQLVRAGAVPMARLDESVSRVLEAKQWLGLLHAPVPSRQSALLAHVGKDKDLALESARASVTLLLNRALQGPRLDKACSAISAETSASTGFDLPNGQFMRSEVASAEACRTRCSWEAACEVWLYQGSWADSHPDWPSCFLKRGGAQLVDGPDGQGNAAGTCAPAPIPPPTLPLQLGGGGARARVLLTGPTSDSLTYQSGGWSVRWQGACADSDFEAGGETVRQALARLLPANVELVHTAGCVIRAPTHATATCGGAAELNATLAAALSADVAVVAIGEEAYTEKPGDIDDLDLHAGQLELVRRLAAAAPRLPIVLVLIAGRPRLLRGLPQLPSVVGVVWAGVPGPHGGTAIGEVLLGLTNPSGRLPITYPALPNALGTHYQSVSARCSGSAGGYLSGGTTDCPVEWPFGHGLSYTRFEYSHMATTPSRVLHPVRSGAQARAPGGGARARPRPPCAVRGIRSRALRSRAFQGQFGVRLTVSNVGSVGGRHSVLLFASQEYRSGGVAPETQRLVGFTNVFLQPGESAQVELSVSTQLFAYHSEQMVELVESGMYKLHAAYGDSSVQADVSVSAAGLGATMLGPAGGREGEGYGRTSATTLPWMAIVVSGSVLTTTCFICGAFLAALVLRRLRLRNGAVKSSYDAPGETELPEADRNGFSSLSRRSMYGWLQWKSAANLDVTRNNSIGDQMSDLQSAPSRTYA